MKPQKTVIRETVRVGVGTLLCTAVMELVYLCIGRMSVSVLLGGVYTALLGTLNFFALGMTVQTVLGGIQGEDETAQKNAKLKMRLSYTGRMIALFLLIVLGITVLKFDALASLIPLLFPRIIITIMNVKNKNNNTAGSDLRGN